MILSASFALLCLLVVADASAIKGRNEQLQSELDTKRLGLASPALELRRNQQKIEHLPLEHRELSKTTSREEQRRDEKLEDLGQQREESLATQIKEPKREGGQLLAVKAPLSPYEAKPQLRGDDLAKGQSAAKPLLASKTTHLEERREESLVQLNEKHEELLGQQREELPQRTREEAKRAAPVQSTRSEAELKGGERKEQKLEETQEHQQREEQFHQQREESLKSTETIRRAEQQTVDLRPDWDQQRRFEADQPAVQLVEQQQVRYEEPSLQQQVVQQEEEQRALVGNVKGARGGAFAEAEPYAFDYSIEGSSRRETGDVHGVVRGQYTVLNGDGSQRVVDYIADRDGFRAQVNTGELGTENQQPASVLLRSSQPAAQDISLQLEGKTREFLTALPQAPAAPLAIKTVARADNWNYGGKTANLETQQTQRKGGSDWADSQPAATKSANTKEQQPELIKEERAPILITHQPIKSTVQRVEEEAPLRHEPLKQETVKQEPLKEEPLKQELATPAELPAKKTELTRTPKSIGELRGSPVIQARASFESATAHRPIVHSFPVAPVAAHHQHHRQQQPVVHRHQSHLVPVAHNRIHISPPVRTYQLAAARGAVPSRAQLQHDRYPPLNSRVSFYSANNFDDEQPAGFEHPINSS